MTLFGNDVSSNNGSNNVDLENNDFSIVKISEGLSYYNPSAYFQSKQAQDAGKLLGYYHWLTPGLDPVAQADYFLAGVGPDAYIDGIILALDYEESALNGTEAKPFLDRIHEKTGKSKVIYMNADFASGRSGMYDWSDIAGDTALWLAGGKLYGKNLNYDQFPQDIFDTVKWWDIITIWQYTSSPYDRNALFGDATTWAKLGSTQGTAAPQPQPKPKPVRTPNYNYEPANAPKFGIGTAVQILPGANAETNGYDLKPHRLWQGVVKKNTPVQWSKSEYEYYIEYNNGEHNDHVLEQDLQLWAATNN